MKKAIAFFLFFCTSFLWGQTSVYFPFPDSNAVWCDTSACIATGATTLCSINNFMLSGDTMVNNLVYHKLIQKQQTYQAQMCYYCQWNSPVSFTSGYVGSIRQDTSLRKVYYLPPMSTTEVTMFDFSIGVGDTAKNIYNYGGPTYPIIVGSMDSILINAKYRKRWNIQDSGGGGGYILIEGIGSTQGLMKRRPAAAPGGGWLYCFSQNNQRLYPYYIPSAGCVITTGIEELKQLVGFSLAPNPNSGVFIVDPKSHEKQELIVIDLNGKTLLKMKIYGETKIDLSDYDNGVYIISLRTEDEITYRKLIKN